MTRIVIIRNGEFVELNEKEQRIVEASVRVQERRDRNKRDKNKQVRLPKRIGRVVWHEKDYSHDPQL